MNAVHKINGLFVLTYQIERIIRYIRIRLKTPSYNTCQPRDVVPHWNSVLCVLRNPSCGQCVNINPWLSSPFQAIPYCKISTNARNHKIKRQHFACVWTMCGQLFIAVLQWRYPPSLILRFQWHKVPILLHLQAHPISCQQATMSAFPFHPHESILPALSPDYASLVCPHAQSYWTWEYLFLSIQLNWRCNTPCSSLRAFILFPNNNIFYYFSRCPNLRFPNSHQSQHHCVWLFQPLEAFLSAFLLLVMTYLFPLRFLLLIL